MSRFATVAALSTVLGLAAAMQTTVASAADPAPMAKTEAAVKCFGVNAVAKNDCAAGSHSCAGQASMARDPKSFILIPAGACAKIAGGTLNPA
ncbi:MAG: DUF2282 domain-containing protein [Azospirillaceae bacterium]|nr:DUF2282 domain-containing protein [Azospirillaceae bacterium]